MEEQNKSSVLRTILIVITGILMVFGFAFSVALWVWAVLTLIFAWLCERVGQDKGIDGGFYYGWFLGILGLLIVLVLQGNNKSNTNSNKYDDLAKLQKLKENGTITELEFEREKDKLLK